MTLKKFVKNLLPRQVWSWYYFFLAWWGAFFYRHPSRHLLVIGITGTSGKSSIIYILRQLLEQTGYKVGALSTIEFYINGWQKLNDRKMTMLGRAQTQAFLRRMVNAGCDIAIIETTSQAALQYRHRFINYDIMLLTNLYPEHIEAHGGFENYKNAKIELFKHLAKCAPKKWRGDIFPKTAILNGNNEHAADFACAAWAARHMYFGHADLPWHKKSPADQAIECADVRVTESGTAFSADGHPFNSPFYGVYAIMNISAGLATAQILGVEWLVLQKIVPKLLPIPGRLEFIEAGQHFKVIVDYAFEPIAMNELYKTIAIFKPRRLIHVLGSTGGGRDVARRFSVGNLVGKKADFVIVTDEDPYDTPPKEIMRDVATAAAQTGKQEEVNLWQILDRRRAIAHAFSLADEGDLVLITGKGCEQAICVANDKKIPWDDRVVAREELKHYAKG